MSQGGYTRRYEPAGIVHRGELIVPAPFNYPKWTRFIWPSRLRSRVRNRFRTYNPDKDMFFALTGKRIFDE